MKIPVILIHNGCQDYLTCAINQALKNNPVHLIGDGSLTGIGHENFNFEKIEDYKDECNEIRSVYEHLNTTPAEFEIFCYQRWFILKAYMKKNNLEKIFYIDSDVLLFTDVTKEWKKFDQYTMTLLHRSAAVSSFITLEGVENFCNLVLSTFRNKSRYEYKKIASHYHVRNQCGLGGGVCDMTFLEFFHYDDAAGGGPGRVGEMMQIIDGSTYDHNINTPDQDFEFKNGIKNIKIINGIPFVYNTRLEKNVKFNSLHFCGGAKNLMRSVYEKCN
tara:strand:+ start:5373 stop:6194 length:822 start_codon:yes stop_codon:yes gene_type:complete